jgi:hypothetical protein
MVGYDSLPFSPRLLLNFGASWSSSSHLMDCALLSDVFMHLVYPLLGLNAFIHGCTIEVLVKCSSRSLCRDGDVFP